MSFSTSLSLSLSHLPHYYPKGTMATDSSPPLDMETTTCINTEQSTTSSSCSNSVAVLSSLKRKRPPMIEIPNVLQEIETDTLKLRNPTTPRNEPVCYNGDGVGVFAIKGKRKKLMEDTHKIVSCSQSNNSKKGFFGVYDGHGGKKAADFVAEHLHTNVFEKIENGAGDVTKEDAIKYGYLKTDQQFLQLGLDSGACCVTAIIEEECIVVSNLGDCRAVLCNDGVAEALTKDHRVKDENEQNRIENKGGYVAFRGGAWRVNGVLAVSRSIGDAYLKNWLLAEPETKILHMSPEMQFLVLASDGLWDQVGNQEAVDTVIPLYFAKKKLGPVEDIFNDINTVGSVNVSPSSKLRRISLNKQQKEMAKFPTKEKTVDNRKVFRNEIEFACDNEDPPSKLRKENIGHHKVSASTELTSACNEHVKLSTSRGSFDEIRMRKDTENENEGPPSKSRRISLVKRINMRSESPHKENCCPHKIPSSTGLAGVCKELVKLAVSRGSLDDITVMIIDLNHFRCVESA